MKLLSLVLGFLGLGLLLLWRTKLGKRPAGCPPGPPTLPIIGNLHQMPKSRSYLQFEKWARQYGYAFVPHLSEMPSNSNSPIYSLIIGCRVIVVLSSDIVVKDLLDKKGAIYSSRPDMYLVQDVASGGLRFSLMVTANLILGFQRTLSRWYANCVV